MRAKGQVESPFVFAEEAAILEEKTSLTAAQFANEISSDEGRLLSLKTANNRCVFYQKGYCSVYAHRPLDCRIFPFDIIENANQEFYWIVYLDLCPIDFSYERYFGSAKSLFDGYNLSTTQLHHFAAHGAEIMRRHRHEVLERVTFNAEDGWSKAIPPLERQG
jgi:Fe-S-cluster containining protein